MLRAIEDPHRRLQESAASIRGLRLAGRLAEAKDAFSTTTLVRLSSVQDLLHEIVNQTKERIAATLA